MSCKPIIHVIAFIFVATVLYAASSYQDSKTLNDVIRTETRPGFNTAERIGTAMNAILDAAILEVSEQSENFISEPGYIYSIDSTAGTVTVTVDTTPEAGDMFAISDRLGTFSTNNCTVDFGPNNLHGLSAPNNTFIGDKVYTHRAFRYDGTRWLIIE